MHFHVFAHVEAHHRVLIRKERFRQCAGKLRLSHARWAKENVGADRPAGILQPGAGAADGAGNGGNSLVLPDDAPVQRFFQVQQLLAFVLGEPANGDARPCVHNFRDILFGDDGFLIVPFALPVRLDAGNPRGKVLLLIAQRGGAFVVLVVDGFFLFFAQRFNAFAQRLHIRRGVVGAEPDTACSLIHKVDGLVRQETVGNIAAGKFHGCADGLIRDARFVVRFIAVPQAKQDGNGLFL